jgi:predicted AlkP superfamily phosphohydrolase/phosphomutase
MTAPTRRIRPGLALAAALLAAGCGGAERRAALGPREAGAPWIVVGVDGGERRVLERLWQHGELPNLAAIAARGVFADLATDYGASPVIWTTIATGVPPSRHGITDFVIATDAGDVPVSSAARRSPALWEMLTRAHRRVAVLGWWATWPAEPIDGLVVTDRVASELPERIHPAAREPELRAAIEAARAAGLPFGGNEASEIQDRVVTRFAVEAVAGGYDLVLPYYRSVDLASHQSWRLFQPAAFGDPPPARPGDDPVSAAYRAFDAALGEILAAAPAGSNVVVLSDHGFRATRGEQVQLLIDLDRVLEAAGLLVRAGAATDPARSFAYSYRSPDYRATKFVRFSPAGSEPAPAALAAARDRLAAALGRVRFAGGAPAFRVREPRPRELGQGAHAVVVVESAAATPALELDGVAVAGAVRHLGRISGSHDRHTRGIFLAAGPAIERGADLAGISIHDIAPTLLYALGLPVAEDFAGRARTELFTAEFRVAHPPRRIASWGERTAAEAPRSAADRGLLEELAGLGYLN